MAFSLISSNTDAGTYFSSLWTPMSGDFLLWTPMLGNFLFSLNISVRGFSPICENQCWGIFSSLWTPKMGHSLLSLYTNVGVFVLSLNTDAGAFHLLSSYTPVLGDFLLSVNTNDGAFSLLPKRQCWSSLSSLWSLMLGHLPLSPHKCEGIFSSLWTSMLGHPPEHQWREFFSPTDHLWGIFFAPTEHCQCIFFLYSPPMWGQFLSSPLTIQQYGW